MSRRRCTVAVQTWALARAFTIARGTKTAAEVICVEIDDDGNVGRGECVPYPRYGETAARVAGDIERLRPAIEAGLSRQELQDLLPAGAARNALDCALWDLEAKASGRRVWELAGLAPPAAIVTAETIAIDSPQAMAAAAARLADRPLLKIKVGADAVLERVGAVREAAPLARLIVDANEGWSGELLMAVCEPLAALGVEVIEQPLRAGDDDAIAGFRPELTLCADESCHTVADLIRLADRYQMVNVKLDKAGGLTGAIALVAAAREHGIGLMIGCMVATSLAIAPAQLLAGQADFVDLDGPLWLAADRQPGLRFEAGWLYPAEPALWG